MEDYYFDEYFFFVPERIFSWSDIKEIFNECEE